MTSVRFREEAQVRAVFEEEKYRCGSNYDEETNNNNQTVVDTDSDETPEGSHGSWEESSWTNKKETPRGMMAPPGTPSYIAKDANSLTFQWEPAAAAAAAAAAADSEETTTAAAVEYQVEMQQVDVVPGSLTPSSNTARTLVDEEKWSVVYCGKELWTQVKALRAGSYYAVRICGVMAEESLHQKSQYSKVVVLHTTPTIPSQMQPPQLAGLKHDVLELRWEAPWEDGGSEVTGYRLQMCPPPGAPFKKQEFAEVYVGSECTTCVVNLSPCVKYKTQVKAINDVGEGPWSLPSCFTTKPSLPEVPQNLHAVALAPGHVELEWSLAQRNGRNRDHYEIEVENVEQGIVEHASIGQSHCCDIEGLECGQAYRFRVRAENETGASDWSTPVTLCLAPCPPGPPSPPFVTSTTERGVSCAWYPPQVLGGKTVIQYQAEVISLVPATDKGCKQAWQVVYQGPRCDCLLNGLLPGSMYCLRVIAWNEAGWGMHSLPLHFETAAGIPQKPLVPQAVERSHRLLRLTWVAPLHNGGRPVEKYKMQICHAHELETVNDDTEPFTDVYEGSKNSVDLTEIVPGRNYALRVCAVNAIGMSEWSDIGYETVPFGPPPAPQHLHLVHRQSRSLQIRWEGVAQREGVTYVVARAKCHHWNEGDASAAAISDLEGQASASVDDTPEFHVVYEDVVFPECQIMGLEPSTRYIMKVKAKNADGESAWSAPLTAETDVNLPLAPTQLQVWETTCTSMHLSWRSSDPDAHEIFSLEIKKAGDEEWTEQFCGKESECSLNQLEAGEEYLVRVKKSNENGSSPFSEVLSVMMDSTEPSIPETPSVTQITCCAVRIQWNAPEANGRSILHYRVEVHGSDGSLFEVEVPSPKRFVRIGDLSAQTDYSLRLAAVNDEGSSGWSEAVTAMTKMAPPPMPLDTRAAVVDAAAGCRSVRVCWKIPEWTEELYYDVEATIMGSKKAKGSTPTAKATVTSTSCLLDSLERNMKYEIRVRATTLTGISGKWSEPCTIRIPEEQQSTPSTSAKGTPTTAATITAAATADVHESSSSSMFSPRESLEAPTMTTMTTTMRRLKKGQAIVAAKTKNPLKKRKSFWNVLGPYYVSAIVVLLVFFGFFVLCLQE